MRKLTYWICFSLVAFASIYTHAVVVLWAGGVYWPVFWFLFPLAAFATITPGVLAPFVPPMLAKVLSFILLALVVRRLYLLLCKGQGVPDSFVGLAKLFGYVGAGGLVLAVAALALTIAVRAGSGVPAGLLLIPAMFCTPWAIFLAEVLSFRRSQRAD